MTVPAWVKGTLLLAVTFAAGVAIGVGYERRQAPAHHAGGMEAHDVMHRLARDLDLDSAQQRAITEILARHQTEVDSTWHTMQPHVRATLDSTHQEILGVLRPEQVAKYRKMIEAQHPARQR